MGRVDEKSKLVSLLLCTDGGGGCFYLGYGAAQGDLLRKFLREPRKLRLSGSSLLGTISSLASGWLLQSTVHLRAGSGPGDLNSRHSCTASVLPTEPSSNPPGPFCVRVSVSPFAHMVNRLDTT